MYTNSYPGGQRSWADLPIELLSFIAIRLPLLELLSFRGTCKDFRSASSAATAKVQSSLKPWLLLHKTNNSKCLLYSQDQSKTYHRNIPDLDNATCLASYQGWLLLHKHQSIFFFSPFCLSKIPLPSYPQTEITGHVATFTHVPTSPDCTISIINPRDQEINMLSKGQNTWTRIKIRHQFYSDPVFSGATFDHKTQTFYYMYGKSSVLAFSVKDEDWHPYRIVHDDDENKDLKRLPYTYRENKFYNIKKEQKLDVEDDECVEVCGLTMYEPANSDSTRKVYLNEAVNVSDSKTAMCKAVWVQPRFYHESHQDLHW